MPLSPAFAAAWLALAASAGPPVAAAEPAGGEPEARSALPPGPWFTDEAAAAGIDFAHFNGMSGELYLPENTGVGAALFDYDNDGDLDVYLAQGHMLGPGKSLEDAPAPPAHPVPLSDRLYRNDLEVGTDGSRTLRFTDVTEESGLAEIATGYGMGVATGDFDGDGHVDLYVANFGSNQLLMNDGDGTFTDATEEAGADDARWSIGASVVDYDRDGHLDILVVNYVTFSWARHRKCATASGAPDYCSPLAYEPESDRLLRNRGDGTFEDVSSRTGIAAGRGNGLGAIAADFDQDGWPDLYVANDQVPNFLWMSQRGETFREDALLAGCAVNREGKPEASMGIDAADVDADGDPDLVMGHLTGETNTFYRNDGDGLFLDETARTGIGSQSMSFTTFGSAFLDFDNDGRLDLLTVNGAVQTLESLARRDDPYPLHQTNQLFHNLGDLKLVEVTERAGEVFALSEVSRGLALGDVDNDGDMDAVVVNNLGPARLLVNRVGQDRHWIGLRLVAGDPPRDMLGARVAIVREGAPTLWRRAYTDGSYASARDPRVLVGLGDRTDVDAVRVAWPDGRTEEWEAPAIDRYTTLRRGTGTALRGSEDRGQPEPPRGP